MPYIGNQPYQGVIDSGNILDGSIQTIDLANSSITGAKLETIAGLTAGSYTTANITVDGKGRITSASNGSGGVSSITGTADQITASSSTGAITLSLPQSINTTSSPSFATVTLTGELRGPSTLIIDPAAVGDDTGTVRIRGNLQVDGTTTTVNSTTLEVADLNIVVGKNATTAAAATGAGITIGNYASNPTILYGSTNNTFAINRGVEVTGVVSVSGSINMLNTTNGIYGHYYSTVTNGNITFYNAYNNTDPRFIWYGGTGSNLTYHTNNLALYPGTDVGLNLGLSNFRWNNFYVSTVYSGHMYPSTDNSYDLGSFTARWRNIYTADMHFSNYGSQNSVDGTWGNWTLQEGEENIYMLNNRTGRRYKIALEEV